MPRKSQLGFAATLAIAIVGCPGTFAKTLHRYDFRELRPPSTLVPPGTVVALTAGGSARPKIICEQAASVGEDFEVPFSRSMDVKLTRDVTATFGIDSDFLKTLRLNATYSSIKNIRLQLSNVEVAQLSWDRVVRAIQDRRRRPECWKAMELAYGAEVPMSMIEAVLRADVQFTIEYQKNLGVGINRQQIAESLAADLGLVDAHLSSVGAQEITGGGLFWGVRDDQRLLAPDTIQVGDQPSISILYLTLWKQKFSRRDTSSVVNRQCTTIVACPTSGDEDDDPLRKPLRLLPKAPIQAPR